jgi:hypothetical protein
LRREILEKWNGVTVWEQWVNAKFGAVVEPKIPLGVCALLSSSNDATSHGLLTNPEITVENIAGRTWSIRQDSICG